MRASAGAKDMSEKQYDKQSMRLDPQAVLPTKPDLPAAAGDFLSEVWAQAVGRIEFSKRIGPRSIESGLATALEVPDEPTTTTPPPFLLSPPLPPPPPLPPLAATGPSISAIGALSSAPDFWGVRDSMADGGLPRSQ